ncbi:hypothetical protein M8J76_004279 [Diaphorina citri]|nr:hypothetical protein M8J76_004279 [Diaphorina citri]
MEDLKIHYKECRLQDDQQSAGIFGKCKSCNMNFYSEAMFNIHLVELHSKEKEVNDPDEKCTLCSDGIIVNYKCNKCGYNVENISLKQHNQGQKKSDEHIKIWACKNCSEIFTNQSVYEQHIGSEKCQDQLLRCPKCKSKFANKHTKQKHILDNTCGNEKYAKCYFENCNVRCLRRVELNKHIKECHGVDLKYEIKKFPSFNDFDLWKDDFGMSTLTFYSVMARSEYQTNGKHVETITYGCSFDFQNALYIKHKLSNRTNKKRKVRFDFNSSNICPARIQARISEDMVIAKVCAQHNHPHDLEHMKVQKLPKTRRDFLMNAFIMGASVEEVMDLLQEESKQAGIVTKESSLPRRFFKELQRKSLLKYSAGNDMEAVHQFVEDLKTVDGILIYKSGTEVFGVPEELPPDIFMLGIQTQLMLQMLEAYGKVVYIEGLHTPVQYPDYRLINFLVMDEVGNAFPVAYFITNGLSAQHLTILFSSLKPRVGHLNVESLVVQSDQFYEVALSSVLNTKTIFINQWDLSCLDEPRKKVKGNQSFEYAVVVDGEEEEVMSEEQLHLITEQTVIAADDCVKQFHRDLRAKLKRSHSMFILLNELITYFKKRYSAKFNLTLEDNVMPRLLKQMRQRLFEFQVENVTETEGGEANMFDETFEAHHMSVEEGDGTQDSELSTYIQTEESMEDFNGDDDYDEELTDSDIQDNTQDTTTDDKEILREIIATDNANNSGDDSSLHVVQEYQKSIIQLLQDNPIARPLIIRSVLEETKALYEQVQACCNETTSLDWVPH